jgi:hypothetical protein
MWRVTLSRPLPVIALVGRYPTNKLIGHEPLPDRRSFARRNLRSRGFIRNYRHFRYVPTSRDAAIPESRARYPCIPHPFATNIAPSYPKAMSVRLACLSHAASVRSEPGSNSSVSFWFPIARTRRTGRRNASKAFIHGIHENERRRHTRPACLPAGRKTGLHERKTRRDRRTPSRRALTFSRRQTCSLVKERTAPGNPVGIPPG